MLKKQITMKEAVGQTLTCKITGINDQTLLVFGDEFVCLGVARGYDAGDECIVEEKLNVFTFGEAQLIEGCIVTPAWLRERLN